MSGGLRAFGNSFPECLFGMLPDKLKIAKVPSPTASVRYEFPERFFCWLPTWLLYVLQYLGQGEHILRAMDIQLMEARSRPLTRSEQISHLSRGKLLLHLLNSFGLCFPFLQCRFRDL